jgi:hypothetical protein
LAQRGYVVVNVLAAHTKASKEIEDNNPRKDDAKDAAQVCKLVGDGIFVRLGRGGHGGSVGSAGRVTQGRHTGHDSRRGTPHRHHFIAGVLPDYAHPRPRGSSVSIPGLEARARRQWRRALKGGWARPSGRVAGRAERGLQPANEIASGRAASPSPRMRRGGQGEWACRGDRGAAHRGEPGKPPHPPAP